MTSVTLSFGPSKRIANSANYKWWVYSAVAVAMFLTVMDQTSVNIALPRIADHFGADLPTVQWITLSYVLSTSAMVMPLGRISDMMGRKRVVITGFLIFMGAAALGGTAQAFPMILVAKIIQGVGAAAIQANGMAMVIEAFPQRERGKATGMYMTIIGTGSISGPIIGGFLVSSLGWRSVFFTAIPVGFIALLAAIVVLKGRNATMQGGSQIASFDLGGASLSSAATISLLLVITNAHRLGLTSPYIIAGFTIAVVLIAGFIWWELRAKDPMLDLSFFRSTVFSLGVSARFLSFLGGSSVFFLMPFYLIQGLGYPANRAGLLMVPGSLSMAIMGPISGRLSDKIGTRWLTVAGMALSASAMFTFSRLTVDFSPIHVVMGMILSGCGMGMFNSTNTSAVMSSLVNPKFGIVSGFLNLTRTSANLTGVALATTIVTITMGSLGYEPSLSAMSSEEGEGVTAAFVSGVNRAYLVGAGYVLIAMVLSAIRSEPRPSSQPSSEPSPRPRSSSSTHVGE